MKGKLTDCLADYRTLNAALLHTDEGESLALLVAERSGKRRRNVLLRIHSRYNMLRRRRERTEIMKEGK